MQAFLALWGSPTTYSGKPGQVLTEVGLAGAEVGMVALAQVQGLVGEQGVVTGRVVQQVVPVCGLWNLKCQGLSSSWPCMLLASTPLCAGSPDCTPVWVPSTS